MVLPGIETPALLPAACHHAIREMLFGATARLPSIPHKLLRTRALAVAAASRTPLQGRLSAWPASDGPNRDWEALGSLYKACKGMAPRDCTANIRT
jgi:hypothetical protein